MNNLLLESYIKEALHEIHDLSLQEISLKDFNPKTSLETGLQIGTLSLLAFLAIEMNKTDEIPENPQEQVELVNDTAKDFGLNLKPDQILKLKDKFETTSLPVVYKEIPVKIKSKLRDWLADKAGGYSVSRGENILTREENERFEVLNNDKIQHGKDLMTIDEFVKLLEMEKEIAQSKLKTNKVYSKILKFDDSGIPNIDYNGVGLDDDGNINPKLFVSQADDISRKISDLMSSGVNDVNSEEYEALSNIENNLTSIATFMDQLDENGEWIAGEYYNENEILQAFQNANEEVKGIVNTYISKKS